MGCCPSKCLGMKTEKENIATTQVVAVVPTINQVQHDGGHAVQEILMEREDDLSLDKTDHEDPVNDTAVTVKLPPDQAIHVVDSQDEVVRAPEETVLVRTPPPRKTSHSADDIPISSTYHRVHSAEVAEQESKRQEEQQMEAEEREREIREYKATMGLS